MTNSKPLRILVVDDDEAILKAVSRILAINGHEVMSASSADKGVELVASNTFDFIFVDYKMPEHDGAWFMKNAKIPRSTKVLLSTAFAGKNVIGEMFRLGVCGYLIKPYDETDILKNIQFHSAGRSTG